MQKAKRDTRVLMITVVLLLVSMIGASIVQSSGGKVEIKDLRWETPSGHLMSALLFIPESATPERPAPGIVTSHGWYNNREMQDLNYVEYSRRGYVVMSIDMYGHGHSDPVTPGEWPIRGTGMYDAVELMADLPYVDRGRIGVTGHSNGARAANWSVKEDNTREDPLISAVLLVANDAMYTTDPNEPLYTPFLNPADKQPYTNNYGSRDVGIVAAQFDEFFFRTLKEDGTRTVPREYITTENAQSFLHFGTDPTGKETRQSYTIYEQRVDGENAIRVIYNPYQIHPWNHVSTNVVNSSVEFFEASLGAPRPLPPTNQIWPIKFLFNLLGLIAFGMFLVTFTKVLLNTKPFASLRAEHDVAAGAPLAGKNKLWFWGSSVAVAMIAGISYLGIYNWTVAHRPGFLPQRPTYYIGMWAALMGLVTLLVLFLTYRFMAKKQGFDLRESGALIGSRTLLKTVGLALVVLISAFGVVFVADYFFKVDFRAWVLTVRTFTPDKIGIALRYAPLFLIYFIANSIAVNSFNYFKLGKTKWMNTAVVAGFTALAPVVIVAIQYGSFFGTGEVFFTHVSNIVGIWLFPIIVILPVAAIISRKIYRVTNNPYLPGIINGLLVAMMMSSNTLTQI